MPELLALLATAFWMLMMFDCISNEPDRTTWLWILILLNISGAILYFLLRKLPQLQGLRSSYFKRWTLRQKIWTAEAAVRNIGKAHQYVVLGNLLSEAGHTHRAREAYQQALQREPDNLHAHWGLATIALHTKQLAIAQTHLMALLQQDPEYRCGEASLLYGKVLFELGDWNLAQHHLEQDVKYWGHPEAALLLAKILIAQGNSETAQAHLQTLLVNLRGAPAYHYRRHQSVVKQAEKLAKTLPSR